jgi:hypothetical protein
MANNYEGQFRGTTPEYATYDATTWGGRKENVVFDPNTGQFVPIAGTSGEEQDVNRYRGMAQAPGQPAPTVTPEDAASSSAMTNAIERLDAAATGQTSHGADLVRSQTGDAMRALRSRSMGVRGGPGARVAAARYASREGAARHAIGNRQAEAVKAGEMADARAAHMAATTEQRTQNLGLASERARLEQDARRRDAEREAAFERMAWETRNAGMGARLKRTAAQQAGAMGARGLAQQDASREWGHTKDNIAAGAGAASGAAAGYAKSQTGGSDDGWDDDEYSDERTKNIMYSPGEIKDAVQYPAFMEREEDRRDLVDPYTTPPDIGVGGAPRGYAAAREGQAGAMFGNAPQAQSGFEKPGAGNAPGTSDWARYGEPAKKDHAVDWKHGGATTKKGKKTPGAGFESLAKFLGGASTEMRSDMKSKNEVMYSDDRTKLAQAWDEGHAAAVADFQKVSKMPPEEVKKRSEGEAAHPAAKAVRDAKAGAWDEGHAAPKPAPAQNQVQSFVAKYGDPALSVLAGPFAPKATDKLSEVATSDKKAKRNIMYSPGEIKEPAKFDWDAVDREAAKEPRRASMENTFRSDSKADQARVKKATLDKANRDVDEMFGSMRASEARGPSVQTPEGSATSYDSDAFEDVDRGAAPDLSSAAKDSAGAIPNHAMYEAMKSMAPKLYAYKPEFTPPEQSVGEVQAGPIANKMNRNKIAKLAIEDKTPTGLLAIDKDKALKLTMGSLAVLANDVEQLKRKKGARK